MYRFYRAWKILSCGLLGLLEVSVSAILCHGSLQWYLPRYSHLGTPVPMLRFGDSRRVQLLRMGRLVYSLLTMQIWATRRQGGGADRAVQRGTVCYLLGNTWRVRDYLDYQARVFRTLVIFHGLVPRSCSTLPLLPSRLATAWLELDLQFELQSLLISLLFCCFAFTPGVGLT